MNIDFNGATSVIIKAVTPHSTYVTPKIPLSKENHVVVAGILQEPQSYSFIKMPLSRTKVVVLPQDLVKQTAFEVEFFTEDIGTVIKMETEDRVEPKEPKYRRTDHEDGYTEYREVYDEDDFSDLDGMEDEFGEDYDNDAWEYEDDDMFDDDDDL